MASMNAYTVQMVRTENIEVTVTDATEAEVWSNIDCGFIDADGMTREEYDKLPTDEQVRFIAERIVALGLYPFMEITGEQMSICDLFPAG